MTNCRSTSSDKALAEALKWEDMIKWWKHKQYHETGIREPINKQRAERGDP